MNNLGPTCLAERCEDNFNEIHMQNLIGWPHSLVGQIYISTVVCLYKSVVAREHIQFT